MKATSTVASGSWHKAFSAPGFVRCLIGGILAGVAVVLVLPLFFNWVGGVPGRVLRDPVLAVLGPADVSVWTFAVLYGAVFLVVASVAGMPLRVLHGLYAYVVLLLLRMLAMAIFTLEPPPGIVPLNDPFTQVFYPGAAPFQKDLFFSGHTATLVLMTLLAVNRWVKWVASACALTIGLLVLVQHVHWTVDVLAAIPAAWLAWQVAGMVLRRLAPLLPFGE